VDLEILFLGPVQKTYLKTKKTFQNHYGEKKKDKIGENGVTHVMYNSCVELSINVTWSRIKMGLNFMPHLSQRIQSNSYEYLNEI
jgi:hypothetical protein